MLGLRCRLLRETYEAERADAPGTPEWPPHWMRVYSALVSVAEPGSIDDEVLRELESAPPPEVRASSRAELVESRRTAFVPTNRTEPPAHSTLPARKNATRGWARVAPRRPVVFFVWPDLELGEPQLEALDRLCRRVPYLGRTTSLVLLDRVDATELTDPGWNLRPRSHSGRDARFVAEEAIRVPFEGALDELRRAHKAKYFEGQAGDPWAIGEWVEYGHEIAESSLDPYQGPFGRMVVLALDGRPLDGRLATRLTTELRRAVRSHARKDIPAIHGHHDGSQAQISFAALPFVGSEHADGHLLGLALILPRGLPQADLAVVAAALPEEGDAMDLTCGPLGVLRLRRLAPLDLLRRSWGLRPERWRGPATTWVTAYPIVFDRYLKRRDDPEQALRKTIERSGYPPPIEVELSRYPLLPGALDLAPGDTVRRQGEKGFKPYRHARISFDRPLEGPVVIGSMRHYGLGLCAPLKGDHESGRKAEER